MPQPTLSDVHVNRPLTNISVAYSQEAAGVEFVADRAFPAIPVENKSDLYYTYKRGDFNRDEMQKRALSTESAGAGLQPGFHRHVQLRRLVAAQGCGRPDPRQQRLAARARPRRHHLPDPEGAHPAREPVGHEVLQDRHLDRRSGWPGDLRQHARRVLGLRHLQPDHGYSPRQDPDAAELRRLRAQHRRLLRARCSTSWSITPISSTAPSTARPRRTRRWPRAASSPRSWNWKTSW